MRILRIFLGENEFQRLPNWDFWLGFCWGGLVILFLGGHLVFGVVLCQGINDSLKS